MRRIRIISLMAILVAVSGLSFSGCSKSNAPSGQKSGDSQLVKPENAEAKENVPEQTEQVKPVESSEKVKENPDAQSDINSGEKVWMPASVDLKALSEMDAIDAEKAILDSFSAGTQPDSDEIAALKQKADEGDDASIEKLALYYLGLPATDSRHQAGLDYLKKIQNIQSAKALYLRGIAEYDNNGDNVEKAKPYLKKAMEMDDESAIRYLNDNMIFDMHDEAWEKLSKICKSRGDNAETFLEYIRLQDFEPDEKAFADRMAYIDMGISKEFPDAYYAKALMQMDTGKWAEGFESLKKSAELGSSEGNALLAAMYVAAKGASKAEEAVENTGLPLTDEQFKALKKDLKAVEDKIGFIDKYARNAGGNIMACGILMGHAASEDESAQVAQAREGTIECLKKYLNRNHSRSDCESAIGLTSYADGTSSSFATIFSDEERQSIGEIMIECLNQALIAGDNYTDEGPTALSTALRISGIYARDNVFNIPKDKSRELQYLVFAAYHDDPIAQSVLSQNYLAGKDFKENLERACYWSQLVTKSSFCTEFCRESEDVSACGTCVDAREVSAEACQNKVNSKK